MKLTRWQSPTVANWPGFGRLSNLQDELDRLFEVPLAGMTGGSSWFSGWTPALDVHEEKDQFVVKAEVPGMNKEDIEVTLHDGTLTISGERKSEQGKEEAGIRRSERYFGQFQRALDLPTDVDAAKVKADYRDGVLTINLPKAEEAKARKISVNVK